jgi:CTP:molybdopterin cytidylyltransferase MocA/xanthine/CO dehydrogenase XdhC/CoxF family maturation factor
VLADPFGTAQRLAREGVAFVLLTVVRAVAPTSAKPGDKAIWTERGEWLGWVGGSCAEPAARRAAQRALSDGQCHLLHLTNDEAHLTRPGVELAAMSCYSGGSLEIYVEPHFAPASLIVFGRSPSAEALCQLGVAMGYRLTQVDLRAPAESSGAELGTGPSARVTRVQRLQDLAEPISATTFAVVASHGHFEAEALEWALRRQLAYVGLVASRRRWPEVRARLEASGLGTAAARVHAPAGLELGAARPEEVALSVLSQIVAERRGGAASIARAAVVAEVAPPLSVRANDAAAAEPSCCGSAAAAPKAREPDCCAAPTGRTSPRPGVAREQVAEEIDCCAAAARAHGAKGTARSLEPEARVRFSAIVLAAGLSRRMGASNKLLLPVGGEPMIVRSVRAVAGAGFSEVVVVLGHQAAEVRAALAPLGVRTVLNERFESGQVSSVRTGLAALSVPVDAVMICLGDQPWLDAGDLTALKGAFVERPHGSIVVPFLGERRGNPVIVDWQSAEDTLQRGTNYGCRHFIDENPGRVYRWAAPSDHFVRDVDQPDDYAALAARAAP